MSVTFFLSADADPADGRWQPRWALLPSTTPSIHHGLGQSRFTAAASFARSRSVGSIFLPLANAPETRVWRFVFGEWEIRFTRAPGELSGPWVPGYLGTRLPAGFRVGLDQACGQYPSGFTRVFGARGTANAVHSVSLWLEPTALSCRTAVVFRS